eukprot:1136811-Pelagomonas_calceolata.AAC.4
MGNEGGILSHESIMPMNPSQVHATHALGLHGLKLGQHKDSTGAQTKSRTLAATDALALKSRHTQVKMLHSRAFNGCCIPLSLKGVMKRSQTNVDHKSELSYWTGSCPNPVTRD